MRSRTGSRTGTLTTAVGAVLTAFLMSLALWTLAPAGAYADCGGGYGSGTDGGGVIVDGSEGCDTTDEGDYEPGNGSYIPSGPPPPLYKDYWTPSCMTNGPPGTGSGDVMCMAAASVCEARGEADALYMRHYRQQVSPTAGGWELVGSECRGPDDPAQQQPQVSEEMVLDQAYAAAPRPTANVQPGSRTFVNLPNNYFAEANDASQTVNILGNPIAVRFTVDEVTWDFGDGESATGEGVRDAAVGAPGAVEHAYGQQGRYTIVANSSVSVQFTLPNGTDVNLPGVFSFDSEPVVLPVGEVQTRVNSTG